MKCYELSGKKQIITFMCGQPTTQYTLNTSGVPKHFLKLFHWYMFHFSMLFIKEIVGTAEIICVYLHISFGRDGQCSTH